jgi:hypothetical protein
VSGEGPREPSPLTVVAVQRSVEIGACDRESFLGTRASGPPIPKVLHMAIHKPELPLSREGSITGRYYTVR